MHHWRRLDLPHFYSLLATTFSAGRDHFSIIKLFAQNKEDRKRVEKALDVTGLPSGKVDSISVSKFQFEDFYNLYKYLTQRSEVERLFDSMWVTFGFSFL